MKGLIVTKDHRLQLADDIPDVVPGDYDALVKVSCTLICNGTDNEIIRGTLDEIKDYPVMLGHESAGYVVSLGRKVRNYQIGDLVSRTIVRKNEKYATGWGAFSEYGVVTDYRAMEEDNAPDAHRFTIGLMQGAYPKGIRPLEAAVMITCKEVYSAFQNIGITASDTVMIVGDGPVGLTMVTIAKLLGVREVYMIGQNPYTMDIARARGATRVFDDLNPADKEQLRAQCARKISQYIDAVGLTETTLQGQAFLRPGGMINVYGLRSQDTICLPLKGMIRNWGIRYMQFPIHASEGAAHRPVCDAVVQGKLHPMEMITEIFPVAEYEKAFDLVRQRKAVKVALIFDDRF